MSGSRLAKLLQVAVLLGVLATLLSGCGQALVHGKVGVESAKSGNSTVVVRISGTEGVDYAGSYGLLGGELERLTDAVGAADAVALPAKPKHAISAITMARRLIPCVAP